MLRTGESPPTKAGGGAYPLGGAIARNHGLTPTSTVRDGSREPSSFEQLSLEPDGFGSRLMCFSAGADVAAGVVVGAIGVEGLRHVRRPAEMWLAALPVVLAAHQLVEAVVWWGLQGDAGDAVWRPALGLYLAIAFGVLPVLVPIAIGALERPERPQRCRLFTVVGAGVSAVLMYAVVRGPTDASIQERHIDYSVDLWQGGLIVALYVVATCGPMLLSRLRPVRRFGMANVAVAGTLAWLSESAFISLWCLWAAVTSVAISHHLRSSSPERGWAPWRGRGSGTDSAQAGRA